MKDSDAARNSISKSGDGAVATRGAQSNQGPLDAFLRSIRLFFTKDMGLLSVAFFYIGKLNVKQEIKHFILNDCCLQVSNIPS